MIKENKKSTDKVGWTMYINFEVLEKLQNLEIDLWFTKLTKNSDKISFLVDFYEKNKN